MSLKLKLDEVKVSSFVTEIADASKHIVLGGARLTIKEPTTCTDTAHLRCKTDLC